MITSRLCACVLPCDCDFLLYLLLLGVVLGLWVGCLLSSFTAAWTVKIGCVIDGCREVVGVLWLFFGCNGWFVASPLACFAW